MKRILFAILVTVVLAAGCTGEMSGPPPGPENPYADINEARYEKGILRIRLTPEAADAVAITRSADGRALSGIEELDAALEAMGAVDIRPTFLGGGKYAERRRRAGLHLWYTVRLAEDKPLTRALDNAYKLKDIVDLAEPSRLVSLAQAPAPVSYTAADLDELLDRYGIKFSAASGFDDPLTGGQWHYHNDGSLPVSEPGADINLLPAWRLATGKPEVIVAVVDGGIDYTHEDLTDAVWINDAEASGVPGTDDDGNGFIDDVYGWNFYDGSEVTVASEHATHVAGTIAARNNNGKGLGGVAGGDGTPGSGARVMICQAFDGVAGTAGTESQIANAIAYAADNGAVVCSNSWSYSLFYGPTLSAAMQTAIDYFISMAGMDAAGITQTGPMQGGVVVFAAGNDNMNDIFYPGAYPPVVAVAGMAPDHSKGSYSNYGAWIDVSAPGGEKTFNLAPDQPFHNVLSTMPGDKYGYMQGTSMAVPHVSGIAALIVSKFGGPGYTPAELKARLLAAVNDLDTHNVPYAGLLGAGYIDAFKALRSNENVPPDPVTDLAASWDFNEAELSWTATSDQNLTAPARYNLLVAKQDLTGVNFDSPPSWAIMVNIPVEAKTAVGDAMRHTLTSLQENTTYYVAITAVDFYGLRSSPMMITGRTTEKPVNKPPVISGIPKNIELAFDEQRSFTLTVTDPEGDLWNHVFTPGSAAATSSKTGSGIRITLDASKAPAGNYRAVLSVVDAESNTATGNIDYTILDPMAPILLRSVDDVSFVRPGASHAIRLTDHFASRDGTPLSFDAEMTAKGVATYELRGDGTFTLTARNEGITRVRVTATSGDGLSVSSYFNVMCDFGAAPPPSAEDVTVYPNPVRDLLKISVAGLTENISMRVEVFNSMGAKVLNTLADIGPGIPGQVDVSGLRAGAYNVVLTTNRGEKFIRSISKI